MNYLQKVRKPVAAAVTLVLLMNTAALRAAAPPGFINAKGTQFVDESGKAVILKGCNLGNWLIIELWMFGGCIEARDQAQLFSKLEERFGKQRAFELMETCRSSWITPRDFEQIKSFGFNVVRLPIDYRLLQEDSAPYAMKESGFKWIDRAVEMAESSGIYIILDLHSAPGGQSIDQCTGESGQNKLWNSTINQKREADIWREIAKRYQKRSNVAGYDIMNEPYADHHMDVKPALRKIMEECYTAIRGTGDQHVMFFPGALGAPPTFYGDPHKSGWTNVAFTEHFYPGLFGDKPVFESHFRTLTRTLPGRIKWLASIESPYYVGEFNPVLDEAGGTRVTRAYYDAFAKSGWASTLWSYKLVKPQGGAGSNTWYCVSNAAALPKLKLDTSSHEDFSHFFKELATVPLAPNGPLLNSVTDSNTPTLPLAPAREADAITPNSIVGNTNAPAGWTTVDIGQFPGGSVTIDGKRGITIVAAGMDIFGQSDSFRFVSRPAENQTDMAVRLNSLLESHEYAKAGVMARWGNDPAAAFVMINAFPDGTIAAISRSKKGEAAREIKTGPGMIPVDLRLAARDGKILAMYRRSSADWVQLDAVDLPSTEPYRVGLAVDSHSEEILTKAEFEWIDAGTKPLTAGELQQASLLKKGSLTGDGGKSQEVPAEPGHRYHFSIRAQNDPNSAQGASRIEIRLEGKLDGHTVVLNSASMKSSELATGDKWSQLSVDGTAVNDSIRAVVIITPMARGTHGLGIKLDDASLHRVN